MYFLIFFLLPNNRKKKVKSVNSCSDNKEIIEKLPIQLNTSPFQSTIKENSSIDQEVANTIEADDKLDAILHLKPNSSNNEMDVYVFKFVTQIDFKYLPCIKNGIEKVVLEALLPF